MNDSVIINKMIRVGELLATGVLERSGAEADARALLDEIKQALNIADVVQQRELLIAFATKDIKKPLSDFNRAGFEKIVDRFLSNL